MSTKIIELQTTTEDITPQEVMQMESFKHFTEEEAKELLEVFDAFCDIAYSIWSKQQAKEKATVIPLTPSQQSKAA